MDCLSIAGARGAGKSREEAEVVVAVQGLARGWARPRVNSQGVAGTGHKGSTGSRTGQALAVEVEVAAEAEAGVEGQGWRLRWKKRWLPGVLAARVALATCQRRRSLAPSRSRCLHLTVDRRLADR